MSVKDRGFGSLWKTNPERARKLTSLGGKQAHRSGHGRQFTPEQAREAGAKGLAVRRERAKERAERHAREKARRKS